MESSSISHTKQLQNNNGKTKLKIKKKIIINDNKLANVDKGSAPNKETAFAKLNLNVKYAKKMIQTYYNNTFGEKIPLINIHYGITAIAEVVLLNFVELSLKYTTKEQNHANMYTISIENIKSVINNNNELEFLREKVNNFNHNEFDFSNSLIENKDKIINFIDNKCLGNISSIIFNSDAFNLLVYVTKITINKHLDLSNLMRKYALKKSVDIKSCTIANQYILNGSIGKKCQIKLEEIAGLLSNKKKNDSENSEDNEQENNNEESEENLNDSEDDSEDDSDNDSD